MPGKKPKTPSFSQQGLKGYKFDVQNESFEIYEVDVEKGHDTYFISKEITHIYYIIEGQGGFNIGGTEYPVVAGSLVEVTSGVEYTYTGKMKILLMVSPPWFEGNEEVTKKNENV